MAQTILLFEIKPEKLQAITAICNRREIHPVLAAPRDYRQKLGYLAGIVGFKRDAALYRGGAFPAEMLVFSGMDSDAVDAFLEEYRGSGAEPVALKAILTPNNVFWTPQQLFAELAKEHMALHGKSQYSSKN